MAVAGYHYYCMIVYNRDSHTRSIIMNVVILLAYGKVSWVHSHALALPTSD